MEVTFINVGYGESILIEQDGAALLIDGGSGEDAEYAGESGRIRAAEYLRLRGIAHLDAVFLTHVHEDHLCGLLPVLRACTVDRVWLPFPLPSVPESPPLTGTLPENLRKFYAAVCDFTKLRELLSGVSVRLLLAGDKALRFNGVSLTPLGPSPARSREIAEKLNAFLRSGAAAERLRLLAELDAEMNNASMALRLEYGGVRFLLGGDTNAKGFQALGWRPEELRADVFKLGHHGQPDSVSEPFLETVQPRIAVCSASNDFRYGSSDPALCGLLRQKGVSVFHTDPLASDPPSQNAVAISVGADGRITVQSRSLRAADGFPACSE